MNKENQMHKPAGVVKNGAASANVASGGQSRTKANNFVGGSSATAAASINGTGSQDLLPEIGHKFSSWSKED